MKKRKKDYSDIGFLFYIFTAAVSAILFFSCILLEKDSSRKPDMFSDKWYSDVRMTESADLKHPVPHDGICSFYASVPASVKTGDCLWFKAKNCFINVRVGDDTRAVITEGEAARMYGKTPGTNWVCAPLSEADISKTITIDFRTNYSDSSAYIDSVYIGNTIDTFRFALSDRILGTVICILLAFAGAALVITYCVFRKRIKRIPKDLLYLGTSIFFAAMWSMSELRVMQLFTNMNAGVFHNLTCMTLMLLMMPLVYCYKDELDRINRFIVPAMTAVTILNFTVSSILHFSGIADFHETLVLTHISIGLGAVLVIIASYVRCFKNPDRTPADIPPAVSMIFLGIASIADIFRYSGGGINDSSFYTRIAIVFYAASLGVRSLLYVSDMARRGLKADIISRLAYEDGLTGLGNRTAYSEKLETLSGSRVTIFVFDINNLKYVNDNLGHQSGDLLIKSGADIIESVFGETGKCYRIGGDEFVCIAEGGVDVDKYSDEFYRRLKEFNESGKLDFPLMIALGYENYYGDQDIKFVIAEADRKMYEKKAELKKETAAANA